MCLIAMGSETPVFKRGVRVWHGPTPSFHGRTARFEGTRSGWRQKSWDKANDAISTAGGGLKLQIDWNKRGDNDGWYVLCRGRV